MDERQHHKPGFTHYSYLSDLSIKRFAVLTDGLLILTLAVMFVGFVWSLVHAESALAEQMIRIGIVISIISTPIRLALLALAFRKDGSAKLALASLVLVFILMLSAASKWMLR